MADLLRDTILTTAGSREQLKVVIAAYLASAHAGTTAYEVAAELKTEIKQVLREFFYEQNTSVGGSGITQTVGVAKPNSMSGVNQQSK